MTAQRTLKTLRRRARGRGAAMVEALAVIPFFIIIFAGMMYVGKLYGEKQRTLRQAKEYAWTLAMGNCSGGSPNATTQSDSDIGSVIDLNGTQGWEGLGGDKSLKGSFGLAVSTVKGTVTASSIIGGAKNDLSTTTRVQCNEEPVDGDLSAVFSYAWDTLTGW